MRARLRSLLPGLKPSHARVINLVVADPLFALDATAAQLAERTGSSAATVVRAAQSCGFSGLPELKQALARALGSATNEVTSTPLTQVSNSAELAQVVIASHAESLRAVQGTLDAEALSRAVRALRQAGRVLLTASGTSLPVATDAAFRLTTSGLTVQHTADSYSSVVLAGLLTPGDVLIAVSHSGETRQTRDVVRAAQAAGSVVIGVTSFSSSSLAAAADLPLAAVGSAEAELLVESSSRIAHLAVLDTLCSAVALGLDS